MFESKKRALFTTKRVLRKPISGKSPFVQRAKKMTAETRSGNASLKYKTTGDPFVDQFGKLGSYKATRPYSEIEKDCEELWSNNKEQCVRMIFYIRMITRLPHAHFPQERSFSTVQRGAELRHEGIMRMIWLSKKAPKVWRKYLPVFTVVGSWKDIIQMMQYDLVYHGWDKRHLDWNHMTELLLRGLENPNTWGLIKKYLPQIAAKSNCHTIEAQADNSIAKWLCYCIYYPDGIMAAHDEMHDMDKDEINTFMEKLKSKTYREYRKLKASGTAHTWQQLISRRKFSEIDFSQIHGRALSLLVKSKFLKNQGLSEKYNAWITKPETKAKYTGFVHELFQPVLKYPDLSQIPIGERETINKQISTLVEKGISEEHAANFIVVRDTSSSMRSIATGTNMSCFHVAKALSIYFSEFLTGAFANAYIKFSSGATLHNWIGETPLEKWYNDKAYAYGDTNFQAVIDLFCSIKEGGDVDEKEFPTGILCISDAEFNRIHNYQRQEVQRTNIEEAISKLSRAGFSNSYVNNFRIVLWDLQSRAYGKGTGEKFETYGDVENIYYFSGYSPSVIAFLTSKIKTARELVKEALNQEILQLIEI